MPTYDPALEEQYSGHACVRCGVPLLAGEYRHCGGQNHDGLNCSQTVACLALAASGGTRMYEGADARRTPVSQRREGA